MGQCKNLINDKFFPVVSDFTRVDTEVTIMVKYHYPFRFKFEVSLVTCDAAEVFQCEFTTWSLITFKMIFKKWDLKDIVKNPYARLETFFNCNKKIWIYFLAVATSKDQDSRPKLVISKYVRKYIKLIFLLQFKKMSRKMYMHHISVINHLRFCNKK